MAVQPVMMPAPNAPSLPPPEIDRKYQSGVPVRARDSTASRTMAAWPMLSASSPQKRMPAVAGDAGLLDQRLGHRVARGGAAGEGEEDE